MNTTRLFPRPDAGAIRVGLSERSRARLGKLTVLDRVESTNQFIADLPPEARHSHAVLADWQDAGRGRRGRTWFSPPGCNIYLSLGWLLAGSAPAAPLVPLAVGVMVVQALGRFGLQDARIKWPNDIQSRGRKLAGILTELKAPPGEARFLIIGVGINVRMPAGPGVAEPIAQPWTDACSELGACDEQSRDRLASLLLDELIVGLDAFAAEGFEPFRGDFERLDALRNQPVVVSSGGLEFTGTASGLSPDGGLIVTQSDATGRKQMRIFHAADVSVRMR